MASRQPERYIPHVCDVFRLSPIRRAADVISAGNAKSKKYVTPTEDYSDEEHYDYDGGDGRSASKKGHHHRHHNNYARTLTEKDLKHIERHLSMKKTIRKQLSRHLSQAFVEMETSSPTSTTEGDSERKNGDYPTSGHQKTGPTKPTGSQSHQQHRGHPTGGGGGVSGGVAASYGLTLTKSSIAKSESNFLDLLKEVRDDGALEGGDDSGHCSPTRELGGRRVPGSDGEGWTGALDQPTAARSRKDVSKKNSAGSHHDIASGERPSGSAVDSKKSSFWKKLTIRGKSKR